MEVPLMTLVAELDPIHADLQVGLRRDRCPGRDLVEPGQVPAGFVPRLIQASPEDRKRCFGTSFSLEGANPRTGRRAGTDDNGRFADWSADD